MGDYVSEEYVLKKGYTFRSFLAIFVAASLLLPVSIYIQLTSGAILASAITYITAILFTEISRLMDKPLTKQEIFIIYQAAAPVLLGAPFLEFVYRFYFFTSPISKSFYDPYSGKPLSEVIPEWWVPRLPATAVRSFLNSKWIIPVSLYLVQIFLWLIQEVALAYIMAYIFIEEEKLPYPFAEFPAQMCITLAEREEDRMRIFTTSAILGAIYSIILYGVPTISLGLFNTRIVVIPIPWLDLTTGPFGIENILPGAILGLATDPLTFTGAFLIPFHTVVYMFIGSIAVWVFGNYLTRTYLANYFKEWAIEWARGMTISTVYQRSFLRVWITPFIGFALAVAVFSIFKSRRSNVSAFKSLSRLRTDVLRKGYISLKTLATLYLAGSLGSILLFHLIVPDFPLWLAILIAIGGGFTYSLVASRSIAESGYPISIPYIWQLAVIGSGYPKVDAWLFSPMFSGLTPTVSQLGLPFTASPQWGNTIKAAFLTETRPEDFFKAYFTAVVLYTVFSFIYVSFFWSIAPIPSSLYPFTNIQWPVSVATSALWISRQIGVKVDTILYSFILVLAVAFIGDTLSRILNFPFSIVGLVAGTYILPANSISLIIGAIIARFLARMYGENWWRKNRGVIVAGVATGEAVVVGIATSIVMLSKATWILPW